MSPDKRLPSPRRLELDWVIVSLDGMRRWGLVALLAVIGIGAAGAAYYFLHEPVERRAQRALRRASAVQEEVRRGGVSEGLTSEFDQASRLLEEARADWERKDYPACLARAEDALRRFELLSGLLNREFVGAGQVIAVHGKVEVQRTNQPTWERAQEKMPLYNGDFVKTGSDATCEVIFADSTVYRIGPDSLLEVRREAQVGRPTPSGEVKVKVGQVNVFTALNPSSVVTDSARAEVDSDSRVGVEVADDSSTTIAAYAGRASVTSSGGDRVDLGARQAVAAAPGGTLSERRAVPDRPVLESPLANAVLNLDANNRVDLRWRQVVSAQGYELQVSRSRLFAASNLQFPTNRRPTTNATLKILQPGTYFWRVAALGDGRVRSEWSDPRPFKAFSGSRVEVMGDTTPPRLEVARPTQMGNLILIQGSTEPGATVTINGEPVEVGGDGNFRKTIQLNREGVNSIVVRAADPAGNAAEVAKQVFVEVD